MKTLLYPGAHAAESVIFPITANDDAFMDLIVQYQLTTLWGESCSRSIPVDITKCDSPVPAHV